MRRPPRHCLATLRVLAHPCYFRSLLARRLFRPGRPDRHRPHDGLVRLGHGHEHVALSARAGAHQQHRDAVRLDEQIRQRRHHDLRRRRGRRHEREGPGRQPALSRRSRSIRRERRRQAAHAVDLGLGAVRARQLRHHRRGGRRPAQGGVPHRPDRRPHRRAGHRAPVDLGRLGRFGDLRVHRRQAGHPPRPRVPGHDQLADLRPAAWPCRLLEEPSAAR